MGIIHTELTEIFLGGSKRMEILTTMKPPYILGILLGAGILVEIIWERLRPHQSHHDRAAGELDEVWLLGQSMNGHKDNPIGSDSRPFLEKLGFRVLGKADHLRYRVVPPPGWDCLPWSPFHSYVVNPHGIPQFWAFNMDEIGRGAAYIYQSARMNAKIGSAIVVSDMSPAPI